MFVYVKMIITVYDYFKVSSYNNILLKFIWKIYYFFKIYGVFCCYSYNFWHHFRKMQDITDIFQSFISIEICFFDSCKSK